MRLMSLVWTMSIGCAVAAQPLCLWMNRNGGGTFLLGNREIFTIGAGFFGKNWSSGSYGMDNTTKEFGVFHSKGVRGDVEMSLDATLKLQGDSIKLEYVMTPRADVVLNSYHASINFSRAYMRGLGYVLGTEKVGDFPASFQEVMVATTSCRDFSIRMPDGVLKVKLDDVQNVMVQDNRQWGGGMEVRIGPQAASGRTWKGGQPFVISMLMSWEGGCRLEEYKPVVIAENDEWVALDTKLDIEAGSALDFSAQGITDGPAGKYGWIRAKGPHFEYDKKPGVPQRFYGINFCFSAHNLTHEQSEKLAERLQRMGYNAVRYHHYETNLQDTSKGSSIELNPERLERLDYLHYQLRQRGIYATTDTFVSRRVFAADVFDGAKGTLEMNEIKMLLPVNDRMFENWKGFCRAFLGHVNPYTGLSYAQDPALAWISLVNEDNFGNYIGGLPERTENEWIRAWKEWTAKKYATESVRNQAWGVAADYKIEKLPWNTGTVAEKRDFDRFTYDLEASMYKRMAAFLHDELGSQALLTDMNSWVRHTWMQPARDLFDYVDDHFYIDHPQFIEKPWQLPSRCDNTSPVLNGLPGGGSVAYSRLYNKPFTITEYNFSGPGRYRGVGGIMTGCLAALQDWAGLWRFAYTHTNGNIFNIGSAGYFDIVSDPLNQCAERAFICLYLRGDMESIKQKVVLSMADNYMQQDFMPRSGIVPGWEKLNCLTQVGYRIGASSEKLDADVSLGMGKNAPVARETISEAPMSKEAGQRILALFKEKGWIPATNKTSINDPYVQSANGQLIIDGLSNILTLNTPCTAGGFAPADNVIETDAVRVKLFDTDATVWVSSVDGKAIANSKRMIVTHLTDLQNTGAKFADRSRKILQAWGRPPHLVHSGRAEVLVRLPKDAKATVWRLRLDGHRLSKLEATTTAEGLLLPLDIRGPHGAQLLYEIVVE